jgi:hypothetical protein
VKKVSKAKLAKKSVAGKRAGGKRAAGKRAAGKSWAEKMNHPPKPEVKTLTRPKGANFPAGKMLIPTPKLIDETVRKIRKGKTRTVVEIREELAKRYRADYTCPLTTGIFLRIVAENAEEQREQGAARITPYWRVLQKGGALNQKFPGGAAAQARKLRAEGVVLTR